MMRPKWMSSMELSSSVPKQRMRPRSSRKTGAVRRAWEENKNWIRIGVDNCRRRISHGAYSSHSLDRT